VNSSAEFLGILKLMVDDFSAF